MAIETTSDLSSVVSSQIVDGAVTSAKIADNAVVAAKIAAGAVGSAALASGAVVSASIAAGAVGSAALGSSSVVAASIAAGAVGSTALADNAVVAAKIAAASIGTAKLDSGSATSGQILQANGSGAASFVTASSEGMVLLSTISASAVTSMSFTSIPGTYKHLLLLWRGVYQNVGGEGFGIRLNNTTTTTYVTNYHYRRQSSTYTTQDTVETTAIGNIADPNTCPIPKTGTSSTDYRGQSRGSLWIWRYTEDSKTFEWRSSGYDSFVGQMITYGIGEWRNSAVVTSLDFVRTFSNNMTGTFYLYGVR